MGPGSVSQGIHAEGDPFHNDCGTSLSALRESLDDDQGHPRSEVPNTPLGHNQTHHGSTVARVIIGFLPPVDQIPPSQEVGLLKVGVAQISVGVDHAENDSTTIQPQLTELIRLGG